MYRAYKKYSSSHPHHPHHEAWWWHYHDARMLLCSKKVEGKVNAAKDGEVLAQDNLMQSTRYLQFGQSNGEFATVLQRQME